MQLSAARDIARPAEEVFAFISDSSNNPRWQKGQKSCVWTTPPPIGMGSTYDQQARFLGRSILNEFEVIAFEPGRSITIRSTEGSFPIEVERSVSPLDERRTRVTAEIRGEPGGLFRIGGALLRRLAQRSVDVDYDRLKKLLEDG
jgi:carbon monoxide dehydrogenase subunit G